MEKLPFAKTAGDGPEFTFQRLGGMDQFVLRTDEEWRSLNKLDPKLWMALSCPIEGLEFNAATLELLDADHDGRIRAQDARDAVAWVCERLVHPSVLGEGASEIRLDNLREDTEAGKRLVLAAKLVQEKHGGETLKISEIEKVIAEAASYQFNGDGIVPPDSANTAPQDAPLAENMGEYIRQALGIIGGMKDASGKPGLDSGLRDAMNKMLMEAKEWRAKLKAADLPLGENTAHAWMLFTRLETKLDDYFRRCHMAAFAPDCLPHINGEDALANMVTGALEQEVLEKLPLGRVASKPELFLDSGLNPLWSEDLLEFWHLAAPLAGTVSEASITEKAWQKVRAAFSDYAAVLNARPSWSGAPADATRVASPGFPTLAEAPAGDDLGRAFLPLDPVGTVSSLSDARIDELLSSAVAEAFDKLVKEDLAAPPLASFQELRKLALFHAHLYIFLMNFLSFLDFYTPGKKAIFQAGTLYLDGRACLLCVPVEDVDAHARLSAPSHLCLIYCACAHKATDGAEENMTIAAALTEGNLAALIEGKHGLFIDNDGKEWDTRIIRVLHNPISLREAMWAPYIRISNMISEQVQKFVAAKDQAISDASAKLAATPPAEAKEAAPKAGFDFAKSAGIFAALGLALSAVSAAFAYIANSLASLGWWWPLAIVAVFICISGPSMLMAWFKLRRRGLGPLLDASGWAVNNDSPINILMGATLTLLGKLPPNAIRVFNDPYSISPKVRARRRRIRWTIFILALLCAIGLAVWGWWLWKVQPAWLVEARHWLGI